MIIELIINYLANFLGFKIWIKNNNNNKNIFNVRYLSNYSLPFTVLLSFYFTLVCLYIEQWESNHYGTRRSYLHFNGKFLNHFSNNFGTIGIQLSSISLSNGIKKEAVIEVIAIIKSLKGSGFNTSHGAIIYFYLLILNWYHNQYSLKRTFL